MKGSTTFIKPVLGSSCGLSEESESMELVISEETRQDRLHIRSSKQQLCVVNKNRLLQLHSECLLLEEREVTIRKKGNHVRRLLESSRLTAWSDTPVRVEQGDQHVGQKHGSLRDMDSEPQHRL